ncbi:hypothetical protein [Alkalihalobacillus deserti]|uniref:hypothetical protein n=1 Tax=Alkalihalobacillus deserti TaxID=2879466 RepID=UPI001D15D18E|nr:hypothetical protein [Alkalihalobacillus deserti]
MLKNEKAPDPVEQSFMSTGSTVDEIEKDARKSKLASKPKVSETILGDDGITGRIR